MAEVAHSEQAPQRAKSLQVVAIAPPPQEQQCKRNLRKLSAGEARDRYSLPASLDSTSPVGYRQRIALSTAEATDALRLLALGHPSGFLPPTPVSEQELFEEASLGILSAKQAANFRGHRQITLGPGDSKRLTGLLRQLQHTDAPVLEHAAYSHVVLSRPYRTPFTTLLTLVGHKPLLNIATVPLRILRKQLLDVADIPSIGNLQHLHVGVLADAMERAAVVASNGERRALVHMRPFSGERALADNHRTIRRIERLCGLGAAERRQGWHIALVAQVGRAIDSERVGFEPSLCRKLGATLLALRSERIQPGVNQDLKAPREYRARQDIDFPEDLTVMANRAAYNAFVHWTRCQRERVKQLLLLDRIDVHGRGGKERLRSLRKQFDEVSERMLSSVPSWADLPTGRLLTRNLKRARKSFYLAGQRIYIAGLSRKEIGDADIPWELAVRAVGAAVARSTLYVDLMGCVNLPPTCDLLAGTCMLVGPINQNDVGKTFFGFPDLLAPSFADRDPTSVLVWSLKAKTIADPIGHEEQLLNPQRQGGLVDLRPGPHEVIALRHGRRFEPMRARNGRTNSERAFADVGNFVVSNDGEQIPGNRGSAWPKAWSAAPVWES